MKRFLWFFYCRYPDSRYCSSNTSESLNEVVTITGGGTLATTMLWVIILMIPKATDFVINSIGVLVVVVLYGVGSFLYEEDVKKNKKFYKEGYDYIDYRKAARSSSIMLFLRNTMVVVFVSLIAKVLF